MDKTVELPAAPTVSLASSRVFTFDKYAPLPDTCNSAPVIGYHSASSKKNNKNTDELPFVVTRKLAGPLPWQSEYPCSSPCCSALIPRSSLMYPSRTRCTESQLYADNRSYLGNLLQCVPSQNGDVRLFQAVNTNEGSVVVLHELPCLLEEQTKLIGPKLSFRKDNAIHDMQCAEVRNETLLLTRAQKFVDLHKVCDDQLEFCNIKIESDVSLTSACLSQKYGDKWLQTDVSQRISLYDSQRMQPCIWSSMIPDNINRGLDGKWCSAVFAYEDNIAIATNKTSIYSCDFRKQKCDRLFDLYRSTNKKNIDEICNLKHSSSSPYMFVVTCDELILLDERNSRVPVMKYNHMLLGRPARSVLQTMHNIDIMMLANNLEKRVAFASVEGLDILRETPDNYIKSPSLIYHSDFATPVKNYAHKKGLWFDHRVSDTLLNFDNAGLGSACSSDGKSFTVFLSSKAGDVFSQKFSLIDSDSATATLTNTSSLVRRLKDYEKTTIKLDDLFAPNKSSRKFVGNVITSTSGGSQHLDSVPVWDVTNFVESYRNSDAPRKTSNEDRVFKWIDELTFNYKIDTEFMRSSSENQADDKISKYFHANTVERMSHKWISSRKDMVALRVLEYWPLPDPNEASELNLDAFAPDNKVQYYRSVPYSKKFGVSEYTNKVKSRSSDGGSSSRSSGTSLSKNSDRPSKRTVKSGVSQELLDATAALEAPRTPYLSTLPSHPRTPFTTHVPQNFQDLTNITQSQLGARQDSQSCTPSIANMPQIIQLRTPYSASVAERSTQSQQSTHSASQRSTQSSAGLSTPYASILGVRPSAPSTGRLKKRPRNAGF
ncbi:uncharacterized protein LOC108668527 [Hyalella azteca]|uniref:Uncharacterized protein LOC108668527 n=1 Tax=Hyalella azteca TaxID=294128 RepID=A0A8B7NCI1_HYAAZ|nr:uncharacterized protein LOC108668527 [Hyalella azteca]